MPLLLVVLVIMPWALLRGAHALTLGGILQYMLHGIGVMQDKLRLKIVVKTGVVYLDVRYFALYGNGYPVFAHTIIQGADKSTGPQAQHNRGNDNEAAHPVAPDIAPRYFDDYFHFFIAFKAFILKILITGYMPSKRDIMIMVTN